MSAFNKMSVKDIDVAGKKVIVRVDFNVPLDDELNITDDKRIRSAVPTIKYLVDNKAKVIIMSHLGRPKGKFTDKYSLKPTAVRLSELLGQEVILAKDVVGEDAFAKASALKEGEVLMLENVRFHKEEEENDPEFCKKLADDGEIGKQEAYQHNEGENPDFGRYLLRLTLESLQLQHLKIVSEHLKIYCAVIAAQYTNESAHYIRELW
jgi:3-phosphoglycerate kinase